MPTTVNIHEAKTHFSKLIQKVEAGEEVIIAKAGTPVARLCAIAGQNAQSKPERKPGFAKGLIPDADALFDPALEAEITELFYPDIHSPDESSDR